MDSEFKSKKSVLQYWTDAFNNEELEEVIFEAPLSDPESSLQSALRTLKKEENGIKNWQKRRESVIWITYIARHYPNIVKDQKPEIVTQICRHINSYYPTAHCALEALEGVIKAHPACTDQEIQEILDCLLDIYGRTSSQNVMNTIKDVLEFILDQITFQRSALLLTSASKKLKFKKSKELVGKLLKNVVIELGPQNTLNQKEIAHGVLVTTANMLTTPSLVTRYYGRKIFNVLMMSRMLENVLKKYLPPRLQEVAKKTIAVIKTKGIGNKPWAKRQSRTENAKHRRLLITPEYV